MKKILFLILFCFSFSIFSFSIVEKGEASSSVERKLKSAIGSYTNQSNNATFYMGLFSTSSDNTETNMDESQFPPGKTFFITNFHAQVRTAPGGAASWNIALFKNGASSDITCTIGSGDTECNDITNTVSYASADELTVQFTKTGSPAATVTSSWSALVDSV